MFFSLVVNCCSQGRQEHYVTQGIVGVPLCQVLRGLISAIELPVVLCRSLPGPARARPGRRRRRRRPTGSESIRY